MSKVDETDWIADMCIGELTNQHRSVMSMSRFNDGNNTNAALSHTAAVYTISKLRTRRK